MTSTRLMFILTRIPNTDGYLFEAKSLESCSFYYDEAGNIDIEEIEVLSGKHAGKFLRAFPNTLFWEDNYVYPFEIEALLDIYEFNSVGELIAEYNKNKIGHLVFHLNTEDNSIDLYFKEPDKLFRKTKEIIQIGPINSEITNENEVLEEVKTNFEALDIEELYKKINQSIIGQDEAVKKILSSIYINQQLINSDLELDKIRNLKQNVLVAGSTGTGKTEIIKQIGKELNIPVVIEDATKYTQAGYVGSSVEDMIKHIISVCDNNIELAQRAILVIDEIDKKASGGDHTGVASTSVQNGLLKIIEGGILHIENKNPYGEEAYEFDTSKLTVICLGAFSELTKKEKEKTTNPIGFTNQEATPKQEKKKLLPEDFIKFGMTPEFMGRISNIVVTKNFDENDYKKILLESNISPLNLKKELLQVQNVELAYDEEFINKVIKEAIKINTGARGLKLAFEKEFEDLEFELLKKEITNVKLGKDKPELVKTRIRK